MSADGAFIGWKETMKKGWFENEWSEAGARNFDLQYGPLETTKAHSSIPTLLYSLWEKILIPSH